MEFVDLSLPLENDRHFAPWWIRTRVGYQSHGFGRSVIRLLFGLPAKYLKTGQGWANENLRLSTHGTTHVDAPWHYGPETGGQRARTIDEMPLDWFYGSGVVIDISALESHAAADVTLVKAALAESNHAISAGDIVLFRTGNDRRWGQRSYFSTGPGVSAEATRWLIDQGVRLMGIDAWGFDAPLHHQAERAKATGGADVFWAAHFVGTELEYCHMERLANLDALPATGFTVCAFPLKVAGGSAGPARVVAMLPGPTDEPAR
jgi:kynurenine formamidase